MQVWSMSDVQGAYSPSRKRPQSARSDLRLSVMGGSNKGKYGSRARFAMVTELWEHISAGLTEPRVHIHGDAAHGFKIFCKDGDGLKPVIAEYTAAVTITSEKVGMTREVITSHPIEFIKEYDDRGPVIRIERVPDTFLPNHVIDKLPNSQVDEDTLTRRKSKQQERKRLIAEQAFGAATVQPDPYAPPHDENPGTSEVPTPPSEEPEPASQPQPIEPPAEPEKVQALAIHDPYQEVAEPDHYERNVDDLKAAIAMVNELTGQIGPSVMLYVDDNGKLKAKRRVILYQDL